MACFCCRTPNQVSSSLMTSSVCLGLGRKFICSFSSLFLSQDLSALAKELRELRVEESSRPPVKVEVFFMHDDPSHTHTEFSPNPSKHTSFPVKYHVETQVLCGFASVKVTDYSSSSDDSESSDEDGEVVGHDGTVAVSDIPRIM